MDTFSHIIGQDHVIDSLRKAYLSDRLPHGLVFSGPVGVGKALTARALGTLFLCEKPTADQACGKCHSCHLVAANTHPDFHLIYKELIRFHDKTGKSKGTELSIEVLRNELVRPASQKSIQGRGKVFVVEQAELMNTAAQNAILKTLEEPSGRTLIILLSDQSSSLLPTIFSRCQVMHFVRLEAQVVEELLARHKLDPALTSASALYSDGSIGNAIRWIKEGMIAAAMELSRRMDELIQGRLVEGMAEWLKASAEAYANAQLERDELASKDQANREGLVLLLGFAANHFRMRMRQVPENRLNPLCDAIEAILKTEGYINSNVSVGLLLQHLSVTLQQIFVK